jgi:hypothetical protein
MARSHTVVVLILALLVANLIGGCGKAVANAEQTQRIDEAKLVVQQISKAMVSAYDREDMGDSPVIDLKARPVHKLCPGTRQSVPSSFPDGSDLTAYAPSPRDFDEPTWKCLKMELRDKLYFQYEIKLDGDSGFTVLAHRKIGSETIQISQKGTLVNGQVRLGEVEVTRK